MVTLECRIPVRESDGTLVVLVPNSPSAHFGDAVRLVSGGSNSQELSRVATKYVAAVDSDTLAYFSLDVLALFGFKSHRALLDALEKEYVFRPTLGSILSIYTLADTPVEEWEAEEAS